MERLWLSPDGTFLLAAYRQGGLSRVAAYSLPTQFIDPLPEVNLPDTDVTF
jgi:hypothetical protein